VITLEFNRQPPDVFDAL